MRFAALLALGAAATVGFSACSDSTTPCGPIDLTGSYNVQSIAIGGQTEPNSNGTLQLGESSYDLALTLNGQVEPEEVGAYHVSGTDTWSQTSTTTGVQSIGIFSLAGNTLTITLTSPQASVAVWTKVQS
jgi:hypothetical protein